MYFFQSAMQTLKRYADFKGRASREEFWSFFVFIIVVNVGCSLLGLLLGFGPALGSLVGLLLFIPQIAVAVRRLHDLGKTGKELVVPCVMLALLPLAFAFRGFLPKIVALGYLGITILVFANLLTLFAKKGSNVPNKYGAAPTAFSFAR